MITAYKPKAENELYLRANDYVFAVGNNSNKDNIMKGNYNHFHFNIYFSFSFSSTNIRNNNIENYRLRERKIYFFFSLYFEYFNIYICLFFLFQEQRIFKIAFHNFIQEMTFNLE